ncbi:type VII secretion protein EssC [Pseudalkalibacillus hwajinpoensis]|uniref:Type VII secretion protein EssC n=1 Tax=Guptibacillus hwajinpoensis TaxID=208199 RepID=A0A4U1MEH3_9BACL|nr:type VII secretion protein EssC [Pseudalkalibacillus hwajinpoensis]TKD69203.1 type VII secretion protein EssC [Pseudalkalibacillus hwajinpoensis]
MEQLWAFFRDTYQRVDLDQSSSQITIGTSMNDSITSPSDQMERVTIAFKKDSYYISDQDEKVVALSLNERISFQLGSEDVAVMLTSQSQKKSYYIGAHEEITVGRSSTENHVELETLTENEGLALMRESKHWTLKPSGHTPVYVNGSLLTRSTKLMIGDIIFLRMLTFTLIADDMIEITCPVEFQTSLPEAIIPTSEMKKKYPNYRRTPRMMYELPEDKIDLSFPTQESERNNRSLWIIILPPLMMLIVMGLVALLIPRGIFILISVVMFTTTLVTSTVQYFKDKSHQKKSKARKKRIYKRYLEDKRHELHELAQKQRKVLTFHFPSFERMKYLTEQVSDRLWERSFDSPDFLQFRLGTGTVPASYNISVNSADMSTREMDELLEESQNLKQVYNELHSLPITANLFQGAIGLIGKETVVKNELHQIIGQLAFFHSYHDVRFVYIFHEDEYANWEWMKWLPHFQMPNSFSRGFIYNEQTRDQLLSSIYEMIRERDLEEDKEKIRFAPHYVFIISNHNLISDHVILEYLENEHTHLGLSTIFVAEAKESLSDNIHTLIRYINKNEGDILIQEKKASQISFELDEHKQSDNEQFSRMLRTLNHQRGITNSIPDKVSFLQMLDMEDINELPISHNWVTNQSSKSLAAPVGLKGRQDVVELNLHEKAHGPHGLLAGTTGSGKSEFLQTYILSLAVHYHPHEVAFLLIDYKGGGMAQPFKQIPHLLGTITNIEGSENFSTRALASIKSELKKRQTIFDQYEVSHINDYTLLYKSGVAAEPMPHLFLISDEFAELKTEEPEFIKELVSAARIGRSLGVHLILATQKPGGVIDNQIWSNARFRVALKVQNVEDSREILKNGDAASLTVTGRAYLQVGNNEVYDLFQSAYSRATYMEDTSDMEDEVALVTDLGLVPLSELSSSKESKKKKQSEIEVIVDKIVDVQQELGLNRLPSPWLPPLEKRLYRHQYVSDHKKITFALLDEPEKQAQSPYEYELIKDGNVGVFGSSGFGKTQTILTLLMGIASTNTPEEAQFYVLDFGNGGLLSIKNLPHTADYFLIDEERKLNKLLKYIQEEFTKRKRLFQREEVSSITMYNRMNNKPLPLLYITIDNYDLVKEELMDLDPIFTQFARDGQSLGIYVILSATRMNSVRQALMNNLKTKIVHYLLDSSEAYTVLGKLPFAPEAIPGRAIMKKEQTYFGQIVLPAEGEDDYEQLASLKEEVQTLQEKYRDATKPEPIPMLPTDLTLETFHSYMQTSRSVNDYPIGLHEETVKPVYLSFAQTSHCLVLGQAQKGKTNIMRLLTQQALQQEVDHIAVFDSIDRGLFHLKDEENTTYLETKEQIEQWLEQVTAEFKSREVTYHKSINSGQTPPEFSKIFLFIDGYGRFSQTLGTLNQDRMTALIKNYSHLGLSIVASGNSNELTKGYDPLTVELKQVRQIILLMKKSDQTLISLPFDRKEPDIKAGFAYYVQSDSAQKIQVPLVQIERKVHA